MNSVSLLGAKVGEWSPVVQLFSDGVLFELVEMRN